MSVPLHPPTGPPAPDATAGRTRAGEPEDPGGDDPEGEPGVTSRDDPELVAAIARHPASRRSQVLRLPEPRA